MQVPDVQQARLSQSIAGAQPTPVAERGYYGTASRMTQGNPSLRERENPSMLRRNPSASRGGRAPLERPSPRSIQSLHTLEKRHGVTLASDVTPHKQTAIKKHYVSAAAAHFDQFEDTLYDA